jgi:hypothetical protein
VAESRWPTANSDADFLPYLAGESPEVAAMFWRFIELARAAGPVDFELQGKVVVLRGSRRIFASVRPAEGGLSGHLNLPGPVSDRRIGKVESLTKNVTFHQYRATSLADLDEEFVKWLAAARRIGDGVYGEAASG